MRDLMKKLVRLLLFLASLPIVLLAQEDTAQTAGHSVADMNGRATLLLKPSLPGDVMIQRDGSTVTVKIVVDPDGNVLSAKCSLTCPSNVAFAAEAAASTSKFRPLIINGEAVKYNGILIYTIALERVNWLRFGTALYSTYIFDNLSLGPVSAMLTSEFGDEKGKLQSLDNDVDLDTRWKTINSVKDSLRGKLNESDLWYFRLGMAMRGATAPFQSDKKLDRDEVQKALSDLSKLAGSAPAGVPQDLIAGLRTMSAYKIDPAMKDQELSHVIFRLASNVKTETIRSQR